MKKYAVFMAVAMENQSAENLALATALVNWIESEIGEVFYAPRIWPTPDTYLPHVESFRAVDDALTDSRAVLVYYPDKVLSGALVELGMAIAYGIPTLVYTKDVSNITYMLRESIPNRYAADLQNVSGRSSKLPNRITITTTVADIWPWIHSTLT